MPELPEVETVIRELRPLLFHRRITGYNVFWEKTCVNKTSEPLIGQTIGTLWRKGKYLIVPLERSSLVIHLRMTGQLLFVPATEAMKLKHVRIKFMFDNGTTLYYNDMRKFGRIYHVQEIDGLLSKVGIDAMDSAFTVDYFTQRLKQSRMNIKALLLSQRLVSGLGNIYVDESLFRAGIHPASIAGKIPAVKIRRLHEQIQFVLRFAVDHMGSTISDYRDAFGNVGETQKFFQVYQQQGKACIQCSRAIEKIRVAGRGTHFCPNCQKLYRDKRE